MAHPGQRGLGVGRPAGEGTVGMRRRVPEGVLGPAVDVRPPVDAGVLKHAGERQDLVRGAERVLGAGADEERAGDSGPVRRACGRQAGMDHGDGPERHPGAGELQHDAAARAVPEGSDPVGINAGLGEQDVECGVPDAPIRAGAAMSGRTRANIASGLENH